MLAPIFGKNRGMVTTPLGIDKEQVRADLLAHLLGGEGATSDAIEVRSDAAEPIEDEAYSIDDVSQRDTARQLRALLQEHDAAQQALVAAARALDMTPTQTVAPGAIITLDGAHYVVGVASDEFTSGGAAYSGISTDAPLYAQLAGREAGDTVSFNGHSSTIESIA